MEAVWTLVVSFPCPRCQQILQITELILFGRGLTAGGDPTDSLGTSLSPQHATQALAYHSGDSLESPQSLPCWGLVVSSMVSVKTPKPKVRMWTGRGLDQCPFASSSTQSQRMDLRVT